MKKIIFIALSLIAICQLFSANKITDIYYGYFGEICRMVIVTSEEPDFAIVKDWKNNQFFVNIANCAVSASVPDNRPFPGDKVLIDVKTSETRNNSSVVVRTKVIPYLNIFPLYKNNEFKIVVDIYNSEQPQNLSQFLDFARFYYTVGYSSKALKLYPQIDKPFPHINWINYYWGKLLLKERKYSVALEKFREVGKSDQEYPEAQKEIAALEKRLGIKKTQKELPPKDIRKEPVPTQSPKAPDKEPVVTAQTQKVDEENHKQIEVQDTSGISQELKNKYIEYFENAETEDEKLFLLAVVAKNSGDNQLALKLYKRITPVFGKIKKVHRELYSIYSEIGDDANAKLIYTILSPENKPTEVSKQGFFDIKIKLWLAIVIALAAMLVVFFIMIIHYSKKLSVLQADFSADDIMYHEEEIKKEIQEKQLTPTTENDKEEQESEQKMQGATSEEKQKKKDLNFAHEKTFIENDPNEEDAILSFGMEEDVFDTDEPFSEKLTDEEEQELLKEEKDLLNTELPEFNIDEEKEEGIGEQDYQKKMIMKLVQDGWDTEAIAKEMNLSQREVEFLLKMDE
ncbi:MAG: hypothetical protein PHR06_06410 [Candidatus Cloacimonetes bacterium]|nr:hypothetical protein [Candidatus Cloacimonadota bacterium]